MTPDNNNLSPATRKSFYTKPPSSQQVNTFKMPTLHQFDYIFAIAMMFAFLDAWNIGANDVANNFATSVSSRSLTMKQAMAIGTVMEFGM